MDATWPERARERSAALVLQGPPGIGKSHRFDSVVAAARADGWRVLRAAPAQAETLLVGSALIDLCDGVTDAELEALPPVQASALSAALLRSGPSGPEVTPQAVLLAFTSLIRVLAADAPVLVAVDDVQWLDAQTGSALAFAARRLPERGVAILLARRVEPGVAEPSVVADLDAALPLTRTTLAALPPNDLRALLRDRLGSSLPPTVERIALDLADGNPLYALEIGRALLSDPGVEARADVHLPDSLAELIGRHVDALPEPTRLGLAACSALRRPTVGQLNDLGMHRVLAPAERAGLVRVDGHRIAFTHPLYAAAAYQRLAGTERIDLHARLADVVDGIEERARHLALGAEEADEEVALALDRARESALRRGAVEAALEACRLALSATPASSPLRVERQIHFGRLLFRSGDSTLAKHELSSAAEAALTDTTRARALLELARVVIDTESEVRAHEIGLEALALCGDDAELRAEVHTALALSAAADWNAGVEHARTAVALWESHADPPREKLATALTALVGASLYAGLGADFEACRRAVELEGDAVSVPVADRALCVLFYLETFTDDFASAREHLQRAYELALDEGDEPSRAYVLSVRGEVEVRAARWDEAEQVLDEAQRLCERIQNAYFARVTAHRRAWIRAYRGELDEPERVAREEARQAADEGNLLAEIRAQALLGFCASLRGDFDAAVEHLDRYTTIFAAQNALEPALRAMAGEHVEALVAVGRLADARDALAAMAEPAQRLGRTGVLAAAARAEAVLLAAEGDGDGAVAAAERSLACYDLIERPLERARSLLVKGQVHRRFKQKSLARRELTAALDAFTGLGALAFVERADAELRRVGLRPPAAQELTETERRIALLTADGLRSAEIAAALFLSTKTVSGNLTRIYRKLGVRNRAELARRLASSASADQDEAGVSPSID